MISIAQGGIIREGHCSKNIGIPVRKQIAVQQHVEKLSVFGSDHARSGDPGSGNDPANSGISKLPDSGTAVVGVYVIRTFIQEEREFENPPADCLRPVTIPKMLKKVIQCFQPESLAFKNDIFLTVIDDRLFACPCQIPSRTEIQKKTQLMIRAEIEDFIQSGEVQLRAAFGLHQKTQIKDIPQTDVNRRKFFGEL